MAVEKGLRKKRAKLTEAFDKLKETKQDDAFEIRISLLVDIKRFNLGDIEKTKGVLASVASPIEHFSEAEKQRRWSREAAQKKRDNG